MVMPNIIEAIEGKLMEQKSTIYFLKMENAELKAKLEVAERTIEELRKKGETE